MSNEITQVYQSHPAQDKDLATAEAAGDYDYDYPPSGKDVAHIPADSYHVDPFAAHRDANGEDTVDFRSMGWVQAGLVATAEVSSIIPLTCSISFIMLT